MSVQNCPEGHWNKGALTTTLSQVIEHVCSADDLEASWDEKLRLVASGNEPSKDSSTNHLTFELFHEMPLHLRTLAVCRFHCLQGCIIYEVVLVLRFRLTEVERNPTYLVSQTEGSSTRKSIQRVYLAIVEARSWHMALGGLVLGSPFTLH